MSEHTFTSSELFAKAGGIAVACIAGTWALTTHFLSSEVSVYKEQLAANKLIGDAKLPDLTKQLLTLSKDLSGRVEQLNDLDRLRKFEADFKKQFNDMKAQLETARSRLAAVEGDTIQISTGQTVPLGEPGLLLGRESSFSSGVYLHVGDETLILNIGQAKSYKSAHFEYTFTLKGEGNSVAEIIVVRAPITTK